MIFSIKSLSVLLLLPVFLFLFTPLSASAQGLVTCQENCTVCDFIATFDNVIRFALELGFILVVGFVVWGGLEMMTSGGNPNKFAAGRRRITIALTGLLITLVAWVFIHQLLSVIAGRGLFQGNFRDWVWNEIPCRVVKPAPLVIGHSPGTSFSSVNCNDDNALAKQFNVPYPSQDSNEIRHIINCVVGRLGGASGIIDMNQIYTVENRNPKCNYTRGLPVCGACVHRQYSCHYGGASGTDGSLAVDFNAKPGVTERFLYDQILAIADSSKCGFTRSHVIFEDNHTHVSAPSCRANY